MSVFSRNLRFLRRKNNLKQEEIAVLFHKQANTIGNWENQKSEPSLTELIKLAEYFNVSTQALLHTDLEKEFPSDPVTHSPLVQVDAKMKSYPVQESATPLMQEGGADGFWLILRELRAMNEKLDSMRREITLSPSNLKNSDKSSH